MHPRMHDDEVNRERRMRWVSYYVRGPLRVPIVARFHAMRGEPDAGCGYQVSVHPFSLPGLPDVNDGCVVR